MILNLFSPVMNLLQKNMDIRSIVELTGVPETTITNWKFGYTRLYGTKPKFDYELKQKILNLISEGYSFVLDIDHLVCEVYVLCCVLVMYC